MLISPQITVPLLCHLIGRQGRCGDAEAPMARERAVVRLLAEAETNLETAEDPLITPGNGNVAICEYLTEAGREESCRHHGVDVGNKPERNESTSGVNERVGFRYSALKPESTSSPESVMFSRNRGK